MALRLDNSTRLSEEEVWEFSQCIRWHALIAATGNLVGCGAQNITNNNLVKEIRQSDRWFTQRNPYYRRVDNIETRWAALLHVTIEGRPLAVSAYVSNEYDCVADGTLSLTGRDYVCGHWFRNNVLPKRTRTPRQKQRERLCRVCYLVLETNYRVL